MSARRQSRGRWCCIDSIFTSDAVQQQADKENISMVAATKKTRSTLLNEVACARSAILEELFEATQMVSQSSVFLPLVCARSSFQQCFFTSVSVSGLDGADACQAPMFPVRPSVRNLLHVFPQVAALI